MRTLRITLCALLLVVASLTGAIAQKSPRATNSGVPASVLIQIIRAEDERRWDDNLKTLLTDKNASFRKRAALAAGRIGDELAVPALVELLQKDQDREVRQMAAFALGEIESPKASEALSTVLGDTNEPRELSARVVEALGKIAAALPESEKDRKQELGKAILGVLRFEADPRVSPHRLTILLGLTAALRARPEAGPVIVKFLESSDPRIVADALNTLTRLRLKDGNDEARKLLVKHVDPIVRANAARVLGATEDKQAFDALRDRALHDADLRVRVAAIRALGNLKDDRAANALIERADSLLKAPKTVGRADSINELLEIAVAVGRIRQGSGDMKAMRLLFALREETKMTAPEVETGLARISPERYVDDETGLALNQRSHTNGQYSWRPFSSVLQALGEIATLKSDDERIKGIREQAQKIAGNISCIHYDGHDGCATATNSEPDGLRAYSAFKPPNLDAVLRKQFELHDDLGVTVAPKGIYAIKNQYGDYTMPQDVIVRATAAELLSELPASEENTKALVKALPIAFHDEMNDAALAILDALGKQKSREANDAIKTALDSSDHLIRRRAVNLLKANAVGDFSNRIGFVKTRYTDADYRRAIARIGKRVDAIVWTSKGAFTIEFLPEDAPLTVDNFVMLARKGYFNGQTVPRVVPNFVIQTGDPRGDQNGGPGYSIRCEISEVPYERAAVGMALSGKDTGGSQWFVTHSPQPHLDGGYTVFGRVISGMEVVDNIARGDTIRRVTVIER